MTGRPDPFGLGRLASDDAEDREPGSAKQPTGRAPGAAGRGEDRGQRPDDVEPDEPAGPVDLSAFASFPSGRGPILDDVAALEKERDEYLTALQRLQADFENYKKRVLRQQEEQAARSAGQLVTKLLPALDALDLAELHLQVNDEGATHPVEADTLAQVRALLLAALEKEGLERVDQVDVPFDPVVHDAVAHAPAADDDEPSPDGQREVVVDEVMGSGYRWRGQVLRPAMVRVRG